MKATSTSGPNQPALSEALPCVPQQTAFTENHPGGQSASSQSCMQSMRKAEKKMDE